jgi:hypothetical protein
MKGKLKPKSTDKTKIIFEEACSTENMSAKFGFSLSENENALRLFILSQTPIEGRIPSIKEITDKFPQINSEEIIQILVQLDELDVIHLNEEKTEVLAAYPFSGVRTSHRIQFNDKSYNPVYAMCAIDALGLGFMLDKDFSIESKCFHCGEEIKIRIESNEIVHIIPKTTVVWGHMEYSCCAATSLCNNINFFSSEHHFEEWQRNRDQSRGYLLHIQEAFFLGKQFFEKRLSG